MHIGTKDSDSMFYSF